MNQQAAQHADAQILSLFPTPLFRGTCPGWEAVNPTLRDLVLAKEAAEPGVSVSNVGGWHSKPDLLLWQDPAVDALKNWIVGAAKSLTQATSGAKGQVSGSLDLHAWANVSRRGAYNKVHNHPGHGWSGTYYVDLGQNDPGDADSGIIEFTDPRVGANSIELPGAPFGRKYRVAPEAGMMLVFPAWLLHYVNPFHGDGERISIAFNINITAAKQAAP